MSDRPTTARSARGGWVTSDIQLNGKTAIVTGANRGIGLETAAELARRGARVVIACRNPQKAEEAKLYIAQESDSQEVVAKELDLASLDSVRRFAHDINNSEDRLEILINNAGVFLSDYEETKDGFEMHFAVNHLGPFLLTNLLLDLLKKSSPSRIVHVSSSGHSVTKVDFDDTNRRKNFNATEVYCQSKLMNMLFSRELSRRLKGTGVTSNCVHPGVVKTDIDRETQGCCKLSGYLGCIVCCMSRMKCLMRTAQHGAQTSIYCAIAPELEGVSGKYFTNCKITREAAVARDDESARKLWDLSMELNQMRGQT